MTLCVLVFTCESFEQFDDVGVFERVHGVDFLAKVFFQ